MNKFQLVGGLLATSAAVSCYPIGPPDSHRSARRPSYGFPQKAPGNANSANPLSSSPGSDRFTAPGSAPASVPNQASTRASSSSAAPPPLPQATKPATPKDPYLTAEKAPGKPGYVRSPHTGKLVLVDGIPSGVVVPDQTCPPGEKKFFRVP